MAPMGWAQIIVESGVSPPPPLLEWESKLFVVQSGCIFYFLEYFMANFKQGEHLIKSKNI